MTLDLEKLRALEAAATPGPWRWWTSNSHIRLSSDPTGKDGDVAYAFTSRSDGVPSIGISEEDMVLVAALRNSAGDLLAAAAEREQLRRIYLRYQDERDAARSELAKLREREPTQAEGDAFEGRSDSDGKLFAPGECFVGRTGRRCRVCRRWVWGGPNVCEVCVVREERDDLRDHLALTQAACDRLDVANTAARSELAEARAEIERLKAKLGHDGGGSKHECG